jgi:CRP-like cAMP-binding protein
MRTDYFDDLVASMRFGEEIPREELRALFKLKKTIVVEKNSYFLRAGEVAGRIGYNVSGLMRIFYITDSGTEINKHFCVEKSLAVNYDSFLRREESKTCIQALEDTKLLVIDYDAYAYLLTRHPCWQNVAKKLSEMLVLISHKRESELLLMNAQERYAQFVRDSPNLVDRISQYHIASYLGITPESLSRIRASI